MVIPILQKDYHVPWGPSNLYKLTSCESNIIQNISDKLITKTMGTFSTATPGCQDRYLSKNYVEMKGVFRKVKTSQEFPI